MKKLLIMLFMMMASVNAAMVLTWDANTEPDLKYYKLYQMRNFLKGWVFIRTIAKDRTTQDMAILPTGLYCISAIDMDNNESEKSNYVFYTKRK